MKIFSLLETGYNQFTTAVKTFLENKLPSNNSNYGNNTVFGQLMNVLGNVVQNMMLYIEDAFVEQNKYTAQRKKSIMGLASLSGYKPFLGKATGCELLINFVPNNYNSIDVIINDREPLTCTQNGLIYNVILPQESILMSLNKDNLKKSLYVVQGKFEKQQFVSQGGKFYSQHFEFVGNLDEDYLTVSINNEKWEYVESVYDMVPDGKQWTYRVGLNSGIDIIFGNGAHGRPLKTNDVIDIEYLLHDGELGNIDVNLETYFVFNNLLKDVSGEEIDGNEVFNVTFGTNDSVSSGTNSESMEQIRQMIGLNSRSLVMNSPENYKLFLNRFSFVGYNRTWIEPGSLVVNSLIMKDYNSLLKEGKDYFNLTEKDFLLSDAQKRSLMTSLENSGNQLAGVTYNIFEPELCKYVIYLYVSTKTVGYDRDYITNSIRNLLGEFFSNVTSDTFIPKSDIIQLIKNNISEIDGVDVYFLNEKNETALQKLSYHETKYVFDKSLGIYKKEVKTISLYPGENPNIGLDEHGNIYLENDSQFPILMGGWDFLNSEGQQIKVMDAVNIIFE